MQRKHVSGLADGARRSIMTAWSKRVGGLSAAVGGVGLILMLAAPASAEVRMRVWMAPHAVTWSGGATDLTPVHTPATISLTGLGAVPAPVVGQYPLGTPSLGIWVRFDEATREGALVRGINLAVSGPGPSPLWYQYRQPATGVATAQRWETGSDFSGSEATLVGGLGGVSRGFRNAATGDDRLDAFEPFPTLPDGTRVGIASMLLGVVPTPEVGFTNMELGAAGINIPGETDVKVAFGDEDLWYPAGEVAPDVRREGILSASYVGGAPPKGFQPPTFTTQPESRLTCDGATVTLTAAATASCAVRYQWFKGNVAILGANGPTLTLNNVTPADAGTYVCGATGCFGALSAPAVVRFARRADTNGDGIIGFDDIQCFVLAQLQGFAGWAECTVIPGDEAAFVCANDTNGDGIIGFDDINPFVLCVLQGCPE